MTRDFDRRRRFATVALAASLAAGVAGCGRGGAAPKELPAGEHPVVILAVDGLRADHVGAYGATDGRTPALDALARESATFFWAFAQAPEGAPSLASLLTGFYPGTHRVRRAGDALAADARTLGEYLPGFESAAFVSGEGVTADLGFAQGFKVFEARSAVPLRDVGSRGIAWMRDHAAKSFLLLVEGKEGDVAAADALVGEFVKALQDLGLDNRATLVVLGTCGADLGEHGPDGGPPLYATVTRVPLLIRFPGAVRAGTREEYVEILDVPPTILDACGVAVPGTLHGKSLLPLIRGEANPPYVAFGESPHRGGQQFVALAGYRMIHTSEGERNEVYRLATDPRELQDVAASEAKRADVLANHLAAWNKLVVASSLDPTKEAAPLDEGTLDKLKSLGYVQ